MNEAALWVRAVEYEMVDPDQVGTIKQHFGNLEEVAVLRCVDRRGVKLTAMGDPVHLRVLLASGQASNRDGMALRRPHWPVVVKGWFQAS